MAVHSNMFGGLHLSGDDARKFVAQSRAGQNKRTQATVDRGRTLAATLLTSGEVRIDKGSR